MSTHVPQNYQHKKINKYHAAIDVNENVSPGWLLNGVGNVDNLYLLTAKVPPRIISDEIFFHELSYGTRQPPGEEQGRRTLRH